MKATRKLLRHSVGYSFGSVLLLIAHFVSFPILTRILTINDYGVLAYTNSLMVFMAALSKMGLQHAVVRFYPEAKANAIPHDVPTIYSTLFLWPFFVASLISFVLTFSLYAFPAVFDQTIKGFLLLTFIGLPLGAAGGTFIQFLRAEQKITSYNLVSVVERYGTLCLNIGLIVLVTKNLWGYYYGSLISHGVFCICICTYLFTKKGLSPKSFSPAFLKTALAYGIPMLGYEFCAQFVEYGDRLLVKRFMELEDLAVYSVGYNVPMYVAGLIGTPLRLAIVPIYMELWARSGVEETKAFLSNALSYFSLVAVPVVFGTCAVKQELITLLASEKYQSSYVVVPYVILGTMLYAGNAIVSAGVIIAKKTYILLVSLLVGCAINLSLNAWLIPRMGIEGAAVATLVTYVFVFMVNMYYSFKVLSFPIEWKRMGLALLGSIAMYLVVAQIRMPMAVGMLSIKVVVGVAVYAGIVLSCDGRLRSEFFFRLRRRSLGSGK